MSFVSAIRKIRTEAPNVYAKLFIHNFPFTVARNDLLTTHRMKDVQVGQVLKLTQIREVGSPSYTLKGAPLLPEGAVEVIATVMEHARGAKKTTMPHLQRKGPRPVKTIKPLTTVLRIQDIKINVPREQVKEQ